MKSEVRYSSQMGMVSGIPYTRVNLRLGVLPETINETCTAGAGSLLLEFGRLVLDIWKILNFQEFYQDF